MNNRSATSAPHLGRFVFVNFQILVSIIFQCKAYKWSVWASGDGPAPVGVAGVTGVVAGGTTEGEKGVKSIPPISYPSKSSNQLLDRVEFLEQ